MSSIRANAPVKSTTLSAVVTRADGTKEDLGVIAFYHRNSFKRLSWRVAQFLKGVLK